MRKTGVDYRREYDVIVAHMKDTFPKVDTSSELDAGAERGRNALERLHRRNLANTRLALYSDYLRTVDQKPGSWNDSE